MKKFAVATGLVLSLIAGVTHAAYLPLEGRKLDGTPTATVNAADAIFAYDRNQNITWLRDWNYANTSGYATTNANALNTALGVRSTGQMGFTAANNWATELTIGSFINWRLPTENIDSTGEFGSLIMHLYDELGLTDWNSVFFNVVSQGNYWSSSDDPDNAARAFNFVGGSFFISSSTKTNRFYAVAVQDGDVCTVNCEANVPVPATAVLLGLGLIGIGAARRKQN